MTPSKNPAGRAGRELDAEIAERVFGWTGPYLTWRGTIMYASSGRECPAFGTDIRAAWLVVEKMRGGLLLEGVRDDQGMRWGASFETPGKSRIEVLALADTAPLAICLAALRAIGAGE